MAGGVGLAHFQSPSAAVGPGGVGRLIVGGTFVIAFGAGRNRIGVSVKLADGETPGNEVSLSLPERQLEFPEPAQHPLGKPEQQTSA